MAGGGWEVAVWIETRSMGAKEGDGEAERKAGGQEETSLRSLYLLDCR